MKLKLRLALLFANYCFISMYAQDFVWAKGIGSTSFDYGRFTDIDKDGNVYSVGGFRETVDFDPGDGVFNLTATAEDDRFLLKLNSDGNFVWALNLGSEAEFTIQDIKTTENAIYMIGYFVGTKDFNPGVDTFNLTSDGDKDAFISMFNTNGEFVWAKKVGSSGIDEGGTITIDSDGNIFFVGNFQDTVDFNPGAGVDNLSASNNNDVFLLKLDADGNYLWAKNFGGMDSEGGGRASVDNLGNIYMAGHFKGTIDFDPGPSQYNLTATDDFDLFTLKLDSDGNFVWANMFDSTIMAFGFSNAVDTNGNLYLIGLIDGTIDFDPSTENFDVTGSFDAYIAKYNSEGNFVWTKILDTDNAIYALDIFVDDIGNIYTTGNFFGTVDFDPGSEQYNIACSGTNDAFISKLDVNGDFIWAFNFGSSLAATESSYSIVKDDEGYIYTTGHFHGTTDFDPSDDEFNLTSINSGDIFVYKLSDGALSLNEFDSDEILSVYPNPSHGVFTIRYTSFIESYNLTLFDYQGKRVHSSLLNGEYATLDVSHLPSGLYLLQVKVNGLTLNKKLLIF